MKKKRFFDNKNRNQKWTEEPNGRIIDFADKYDSSKNQNEFAYSEKRNREKQQRQKQIKLRKNVLTVIGCILLICIGYTSMDVYMDRVSMPKDKIEQNQSQQSGDLSKMTLQTSATEVDSISFDGSVMLSSVIDDATKNGFSSVMLDLKRNDGTIGYASTLATVDTINAISSPASKLKLSVKQLQQEDILPIGRIVCYKDNVMPLHNQDLAIVKNKQLYLDGYGYSYLNPDSEDVYNYIRDIVNECYSCGINVFVLDGCDLPEEFAGKYSDGFNTIAKRLNKDVSTNIKFLQQVDVSVNENTVDAKDFKKINNNQIYYINSKMDKKSLNKQLIKNGINSYIIAK